MKENDKFETWKPDDITYDKIEVLLKFVVFISNLDITSNESQAKIKEIKYLIQNIHKPETHKEWNICLDIFDYEIQNGKRKEGFYWRKWAVYFESEKLEIVAESKHTAGDFSHYGNDFSYYSSICFSHSIQGKRIDMDNDIFEFVRDANNYKKYVNGNLKDIEIDVDIW